MQQSISASALAGGGGADMDISRNKNVVSMTAEEKNDRQIINQNQSHSSSRHSAAHDKHMVHLEADDNNR